MFSRYKQHTLIPGLTHTINFIFKVLTSLARRRHLPPPVPMDCCWLAAPYTISCSYACGCSANAYVLSDILNVLPQMVNNTAQSSDSRQHDLQQTSPFQPTSMQPHTIARQASAEFSNDFIPAFMMGAPCGCSLLQYAHCTSFCCFFAAIASPTRTVATHERLQCVFSHCGININRGC